MPKATDYLKADEMIITCNELDALMQALECAIYYIDRLETAHRGLRVRDMEEAYSAWLAAKKKVARQG